MFSLTDRVVSSCFGTVVCRFFSRKRLVYIENDDDFYDDDDDDDVYDDRSE